MVEIHTILNRIFSGCVAAVCCEGSDRLVQTKHEFDAQKWSSPKEKNETYISSIQSQRSPGRCWRWRFPDWILVEWYPKVCTWSEAPCPRRSFWLSSERRRPLCPRSWQLSDDWIPVLINGFPPLLVGNYDYMPSKGGTHRWETFHMVDTWYLDIPSYVFLCFALVYPCLSIFHEVSCLSHFLSNSLIQWMRSWWQISLLRLVSNNSEDIQCYIIIYSFIDRERERVFLMCVYTCVVCEISSLALFLRHVLLLGNILVGQVLVVVP